MTIFPEKAVLETGATSDLDTRSSNLHHVVIGGSGFIGRHVAAELARSGHRVTLASRSAPSFPFPPELASRVTHRALDLKASDLDSLVCDADVVHHYAWGSVPASANADPLGDLTANVAPTLMLLEALRRKGGTRLVFASSGGTVYGPVSEKPIAEGQALRPVSAYGIGKATAELYIELYRATHGLDCRIARISNPYGAGQDVERGQGAVTTFLHKALAGKPIAIWGDGEVVRDYIHILDATAALVLIATTPDIGGHAVFNIGSGQGASLNTVLAELQRSLGRPLQIERLPARSYDVPVNILDISRIQRVLAWSPRLGLAAGVDRTIKELALRSNLLEASPDQAALR